MKNSTKLMIAAMVASCLFCAAVVIRFSFPNLRNYLKLKILQDHKIIKSWDKQKNIKKITKAVFRNPNPYDALPTNENYRFKKRKEIQNEHNEIMEDIKNLWDIEVRFVEEKFPFAHWKNY